MFTPTVRCRDLYSPFGHKHTAPCDAHRVGFTGKERDGETGFDYFGARYYAPIPGRFLSPDPLFDSADPADPQTWNRYSYVFNRPMNSIDPNGEKYDRFGNRTAQAAAGFPSGFSPFAAAFSGNRIGGKACDAAGNALTEGGRTLSWDAESYMGSAKTRTLTERLPSFES